MTRLEYENFNLNFWDQERRKKDQKFLSLFAELALTLYSPLAHVSFLEFYSKHFIDNFG
jgi:hypothetical protein